MIDRKTARIFRAVSFFDKVNESFVIFHKKAIKKSPPPLGRVSRQFALTGEVLKRNEDKKLIRQLRCHRLAAAQLRSLLFLYVL